MCVRTLLLGNQILISECLAKKDGGGVKGVRLWVKDHNGGKSMQLSHLTWAVLNHALSDAHHHVV